VPKIAKKIAKKPGRGEIGDLAIFFTPLTRF
jgi:hypothetical protein